MEEPILQSEIFCQLIRQTHVHPYPSSSLALQCWQLLALCIPIFLPSSFFLKYLELHLERYSADTQATFHTTVTYARKALERHMINGGRRLPPSRAEALAVLLQSPAPKPYPLSVPVRLPTGKSYLAGFDASTSFGELSQSISDALGLRAVHESGFSIHLRENRVGRPGRISQRGDTKVCIDDPF